MDLQTLLQRALQLDNAHKDVMEPRQILTQLRQEVDQRTQRWLCAIEKNWLQTWPTLSESAADVLSQVMDKNQLPPPHGLLSVALPLPPRDVEKYVLPILVEAMGEKATRPAFLLWLSQVNAGQESLTSERSQRFLSTDVSYQGVHYRGEHGDPAQGILQTRLGSYTFASEEAATCYAESPNNRSDIMHTPRLIEAQITCGVLFMEDDDPFVDLSAFKPLFESESEYVDFALRMSEGIAQTSNYEDVLEELEFESFGGVKSTLEEMIKEHGADVLDKFYVDAYCAFDDQDIVERLRYQGYDSIIHGGMGDSDGELEYKTLHLDQIDVKLVQRVTENGLAPWDPIPSRPERPAVSNPITFIR